MYRANNVVYTMDVALDNNTSIIIYTNKNRIFALTSPAKNNMIVYMPHLESSKCFSFKQIYCTKDLIVKLEGPTINKSTNNLS